MYVHERLASEMGQYHAGFGRLIRCSDRRTSLRRSNLGVLPVIVTCTQPLLSLRIIASLQQSVDNLDNYDRSTVV